MNIYLTFHFLDHIDNSSQSKSVDIFGVVIIVRDDFPTLTTSKTLLDPESHLLFLIDYDLLLPLGTRVSEVNVSLH